VYTFLATPGFTLPSQSLPALTCLHPAVASIAVSDNAFMQNSGHCDKAGAGGYNETTFVQTADALVSKGLAALGYVYLNLDDCWIAENRTADGKLTYDLSRFPSGMTWLAKQAHSRKLKLGLYAAASVETCRQFPGSQGYEEVDAQTFADWGADFAKLDSCGGTLANGTESWYHQYGRWADAMNKTGRQMVFSCSWAVYFTICAAKYPVGEWRKSAAVFLGKTTTSRTNAICGAMGRTLHLFGAAVQKTPSLSAFLAAAVAVVLATSLSLPPVSLPTTGDR